MEMETLNWRRIALRILIISWLGSIITLIIDFTMASIMSFALYRILVFVIVGINYGALLYLFLYDLITWLKRKGIIGK